MKKFIFLTNEGLTQTPKGEDIENMQALGLADGEDEQSASSTLLAENIFLSDAEYKDVLAYELADGKVHSISFKHS